MKRFKAYFLQVVDWNWNSVRRITYEKLLKAGAINKILNVEKSQVAWKYFKWRQTFLFVDPGSIVSLTDLKQKLKIPRINWLNILRQNSKG